MLHLACLLLVLLDAYSILECADCLTPKDVICLAILKKPPLLTVKIAVTLLQCSEGDLFLAPRDELGS